MLCSCGEVVILTLIESINVFKRTLSSPISRNFDRRHELSAYIKSVGFQLVLNMLVILRSHRFDTAEQAAAFLGVVPVEKSSGTPGSGKSRLSKIGPPEIRAKLYLASLCGLRFNPVMKVMYERLCQRGKAKMCAIGALMRKLVHWCYGVLHTQRSFSAEYRSDVRIELR